MVDGWIVDAEPQWCTWCFEEGDDCECYTEEELQVWFDKIGKEVYNER